MSFNYNKKNKKIKKLLNQLISKENDKINMAIVILESSTIHTYQLSTIHINICRGPKGLDLVILLNEN